MRRTWTERAVRTGAAVAVAAAFVLPAGCAGHDRPARTGGNGPPSSAPAPARGVPGVGGALNSRVPSDSRQVLAVYGKGARSAESTAVLYARSAGGWQRERSWAAHNGRHGWTTDHHEDDGKSPVGVFTLSDAGGVLPDPGTGLPYHRSAAFSAPRSWPRSYRRDFDLVIAIDYNRVKGRSPLDPDRPRGRSRGGGIWLHVDHGSGTAACVTQSRVDMEYLLRTLDPALHPVVVMGDRDALSA
ncbi:hypothetical protein ACIP98_07115 [Streptomyces sp. NPDC088354]|uniref:hypothetical protein n=1 Tax=Streptomyces sp. NPDC088354 TaxID=3365856 RepID=UPI0037F1650D